MYVLLSGPHCSSVQHRVCVNESMADYCEAILNVNGLCEPGMRCCLSRNSFGDNIPPNLVPNLIFPNKTKSSVAKIEPKTTVAPVSYKPEPITTTPNPPPIKPCRGDCVGTFTALFCENIDSEATCPDDDTCCVSQALQIFIIYRIISFFSLCYLFVLLVRS